jgi:hypothetical protein
MSVAARRIRAGDVILASGSVLLLIAILAHVAAAPAAPPPIRTDVTSGPVSEDAPGGPAASVAEPAPGVPAGDGVVEPPVFIPNSRTIKSWKDLPVHFVHRPHWVSRLELPKQAGAADTKVRNAELHLELMGYDADSIRFAFDLVNRLDSALADHRQGDEATSRLFDLARGGKEAADLAATIGDGVGEEAVRVRAIAALAASGGSTAASDLLLALATTEPTETIRTAAGVSLLWMGRQADVARWVSTEGSSKAMSDFFDSVQVGVNKLENRPDSAVGVNEKRYHARTLVFSQARAVESATMVDALMDGAAPARWAPATRAKIYSIAAQYAGERSDVGPWMEREYARAPDDLTRASILFAAPRVANSRGLEDRAIEVARAGGGGYLVRTAIFSLSQFRTERSMRVLMEVVPTCGEDAAAHAIRSLERLGPWFGKDIEPFLRGLAGHSDARLRALAAAALDRSFAKSSR